MIAEKGVRYSLRHFSACGISHRYGDNFPLYFLAHVNGIYNIIYIYVCIYIADPKIAWIALTRGAVVAGL